MILFTLLLWFACAIIASEVASRRGGSGCLFALLGLIFGPFAILFAYLVRPSVEEEARAHAAAVMAARRSPDLSDAELDLAEREHRERRMKGSVRRFAEPFEPALASPVSVAEQLEKLEGLRDRGTLTQEEFEAQKRKLLGL